MKEIKKGYKPSKEKNNLSETIKDIAKTFKSSDGYYFIKLVDGSIYPIEADEKILLYELTKMPLADVYQLKTYKTSKFNKLLKDVYGINLNGEIYVNEINFKSEDY